jgi:hypothetical protein
MMLTVHLGLSCTNSCGAMDGWMVCVFDIRLFAEANNGILFLWPLFLRLFCNIFDALVDTLRNTYQTSYSCMFHVIVENDIFSQRVCLQWAY